LKLKFCSLFENIICESLGLDFKFISAKCCLKLNFSILKKTDVKIYHGTPNWWIKYVVWNWNALVVLKMSMSMHVLGFGFDKFNVLFENEIFYRLQKYQCQLSKLILGLGFDKFNNVFDFTMLRLWHFNAKATLIGKVRSYREHAKRLWNETIGANFTTFMPYCHRSKTHKVYFDAILTIIVKGQNQTTPTSVSHHNTNHLRNEW